MNDFVLKIKEILENFFPEICCGIYTTLGEKRYLLLTHTKEEMPIFLYGNIEDYFYKNINDNFILVFKEKLEEEKIKNKLLLLKEFVENYSLKYYFEKLKESVEKIKMPYASTKALGEIFKVLYPDNVLFLWLREKYESFYFIVYSSILLDNKFFYLNFVQDGVFDVDSIKNYNIKKFLEDKNIKYVKIFKDNENVLIWGFKKLFTYDKKIDEIVKKFLPSNLLFLDAFEIFLQKIYSKEYKDFKEFARDLSKEFEEIGRTFSLYLKVSFPFLSEEFYLFKNTFLPSPETPENLNKVETKFGEIYYSLNIKDFHLFFKEVFEQKLKEISVNMFNDIFLKNLESFENLAKKEIKEEEIDRILINLKNFPPFVQDVLNSLLLNFKEILFKSKFCVENFEKYRKMSESIESLSFLILKEKDLKRIFDLLSKSIKEVYLEVEDVVWLEVIKDNINKFLSSSRLFTFSDFEEILNVKENKFKWKKYFVLKESIELNSYRCSLYFICKEVKEDILYSLIMKKLNILLYFLINFKEQKDKFEKVLVFEKDLPVKIKVLKSVFSLPLKAEEILTCKKEEIELEELIKEALEKNKTNIIKKNIAVSFLKKDRIFINGYKTLLNFAFASLFSELLKSNRINGKMELEIDKDRNFVYIIDTGVGLSKSQIENLKEPSEKKEDLFSVIGLIFNTHGFKINIEVERGLGNKIKILL
ncbi:MAG: hypothetical protein ABIM83_07440 [candidate division WOR-3 bacterium]